MKQQFSEEQIISLLKAQEGGKTTLWSSLRTRVWPIFMLSIGEVGRSGTVGECFRNSSTARLQLWFGTHHATAKGGKDSAKCKSVNKVPLSTCKTGGEKIFMQKLRLGFIGSGGMADEHLIGLSSADKFPEVQIVALCDVA